MSRHRIEVADLSRHAMNRGAHRANLFADAEDYQTYMRLLVTTVVSHEWELLAFCLMPNHVHLLLNTPKLNLGKGIQWLHSNYVTYFNRRHDHAGTLFQSKYKAPRPVRSEEKFIQLVGYIAVNPVRASLCDSAAEWPWSSHALVAAGHVPDWLAHGMVLDRLEAAVGFACYDELIGAHERYARTKGSEPFFFSRQ